MITISCSVGYHRGGLGQHFAQLVEDARALGHLRRYFSSWVKPGDEPLARAVRRPLTDFLMHRT
ncbi:MAG TPA: hypothetical protein VK986_23190, partial [Tepidisphaeraceae bacterium]|nr:hypothetical protein [Tepidisphaeraceae bacterium]